MGSVDSKLNFRKAVIQLTTKTQVHPGGPPQLTCRSGVRGAGDRAGPGSGPGGACRDSTRPI